MRSDPTRDPQPGGRGGGPPPAPPRYRREDDLPRRSLSFGKVALSLVAASLLGLIVGLSMPVGGTTAWPYLVRRFERGPWIIAAPVMPWQMRRFKDPAVVALARARGLFAPPDLPRSAVELARRTPHFGPPPLPEPYDAPAPPSPFRRALMPHLGPDPLTLSPWLQRRLNDLHLEPSGIDAVATLAEVPVIMFHDVVDGPPEVWFDLPVEEFEHDLDYIARAGAEPISLSQWWAYLTRGEPVPPRPLLLTFDDGYASVYNLIYPRLKERGWPAVFFICPTTIGQRTGKDHVTWDQIREMQATGLFEFQAHSMTHPYLTKVSKEQLQHEIFDCQSILERELGRPIQFFCYPIGDRNEKVILKVKEAGFVAGFTMTAGGSAQSPGVMEVNRYPHQQLREAVAGASGAMVLPAPAMWPEADLTQPVTLHRLVVEEGPNEIPLIWVTGGRPTSVHCNGRYVVPDVALKAGVPAAINGGFFQLPTLRGKSNVMIGPVMASWATEQDLEQHNRWMVARRVYRHHVFHAGFEGDCERIKERPLVLFSDTAIRFVPFYGQPMNSRRAFELLLPGVTDGFVAGGWLIREGHALTSFEMDLVSTPDHGDPRRRAFFGIDRQGRPVIGASPSSQSSETIARCLERLGLVQAVLLDSGFSTSLYYNGSIFATGHSADVPSREVPHILMLQEPEGDVGQVAGPVGTKLESLSRWVAGHDQSEWMPNDSRQIKDKPGSQAEPRRRRRR